MGARFYVCSECKFDYLKHVDFVLDRTNTMTGVKYVDDPTIMAWEIANEPRPMRPAANELYAQFISDAAAEIKSRDKNHLVTIGHEGSIGTESMELFERVHSDPNIDYLTIHIWPKNWGWFAPGKLAEDFPNAVEQTVKYIEENTAVAVKLNKPLVIEEFGLPRDRESFDPAAETTYRDRYFTKVLSFVRRDPYIAGANFWAFGGTGRPTMGHKLWKVGDEYLGDPPMEEQGLNSVFDSDRSTWDVIRKASHAVSRKAR
jgi:mannan endo-1,4-beta-mannosidase